MIRAALSNALHTVGHGFEWSSSQCHHAADKVLDWPRWMDLKTEEGVAAIKAWGARQQAAFEMREAVEKARQAASSNVSESQSPGVKTVTVEVV